MQESLGGPTVADLQRAKKKMWLGASGTVIGLLVAAASFFGVFVPAHTEYKQIKEQLCMEITRADGSHENLGCNRAQTVAKVVNHEASWVGLGTAHATIVNAGENLLEDCFENNTGSACTTVANLEFHGIGTSSAAIAETDTGCTTELTTQYNPDNTRATGSQTNNGNNIYRTVGTNTVDAGVTINEFCLMSQAATGGGTMWTRILTGAIALNASDSLQTTYDLTIE